MASNYFLSKVPVHSLLSRDDVRKRRTGWDINSPTFRHRAVMGLFGEISGSPRESAGVLFRLERIPGQAPFFLVQSSVRPKDDGQVAGVETKEMEFPEYLDGQILSFSVALNAVRRKSIEVDGKRKTRVQPIPLDHDADALENGETTITPWLREKLATALDDIQLINHLRDVLRDSGAQKSMTIQVDSFEGVAKVKDPSALKEILTTGIGREKAYGCGMLSVRPV